MPNAITASDVISVSGLSKTYATGHTALNNVSLDIRRGEIFALLGPNGAGKTTLISIICGLVKPTAGTVTVSGFDIVSQYRETRSRIGLVPQELTAEAFESVFATVSFSRGLFGKKPDPAYVEKVIRSLSLWEKRDSRIMTLSGGMKRRVLIAKALAHEPEVLFLDEPSAGVDVELRRDMWRLVRELRDSGVTIILTTHYLEEAEEMADRVGVISRGELILVEEKAALMKTLGKKKLSVELNAPLATIPARLAPFNLTLSDGGGCLTYSYAATVEGTEGRDHGIADLLEALAAEGIAFRDLHTEQSSLEDIFVSLVRRS